MKATSNFDGGFFSSMFSTVRPMLLGIWAVALLAGCSSDKPAGIVRSGATPQTEGTRLDPGAIAVICAQTPAEFSFIQANGRIESASDGAAAAARTVLLPPDLGHPDLNAASGPIGFILAPFAAGYGAIKAKTQKLPADKLREAESDLVREFRSMAEQEQFRDTLLESARGKVRRPLFAVDATDSEPPGKEVVRTVLETRVEELRLERSGKGDEFALRIKARARAIRTSDGALLADQPLEYRSGPGMFIDWSRHGGLESVARTGYRQLAEQVVEQLFSASSEDPILLGTGFRRVPRPAGAVRSALVGGPRAMDAKARLIAYQLSESSTLGIYSLADVPAIEIQRPLTKSEAVSEAQSDTEWMLDGLQDCPNSVVQVIACAVALPVGLYKQSVGAVRGVLPGKRDKAEASLREAARRAQPHRVLAREVARQLAPQTSEPVMLVRQPLPPEAERDPELMHCLARGTLAWLPVGQSAADYLASEGGDTSLEIRVVRTALQGNEGINPPMTLCLEAQVTLFRTRDGQELFACPVSYRSAEHPFTEWAARDAQLFRQELARCYGEMSASIAGQLVTRGLVLPKRSPFITAGN